MLSYPKIKSKIILLVFVPLVLLFTYVLFTNYKNAYNQHSLDTLKYLSGVSNSLSIAIDGDLHHKITTTYDKKDQIIINTQDSAYAKIHTILKNACVINEFKTSLYTIFYDSTFKQFYFGVSSSDEPFYRHAYSQFPELLRLKYNVGGVIPEYEDEHGKWLSAFAPIKNSKGKTIALVQADVQFDAFQKNINKTLVKNFFLSLIIIIISMIAMYKFIDTVLVGEEKSRKIIELQNEEINQSLDYAKLILDSTLNMNAEIKKFFPDLFVLFNPKYKVGGDFYFFYPVIEARDVEPTKFYIGVFDCTGHGIPGAILSMLGISSLNEIVKENINQSPDVILSKLNTQFIKILRQEAHSHSVQDGMEGCLCLIDINKMTLEMASANSNLYIISAKNPLEIKEIKGSKLPIGGSHFESKRKFELITLSLNDQDKLILCSDGITDQFSADKLKSKKYSNKRLKNVFAQDESLNFVQLCERFSKDFNNWKGNMEQTDDATLIALSVSKSRGLTLKVA